MTALLTRFSLMPEAFGVRVFAAAAVD